MYIWAGFGSAVASWLFLGLLVRCKTRVKVTLWAPVVEEIAKTGAALFFNTDIFLSHVIFGGVELLLDTLRGSGPWPGLVALALHSVLGFVVAWLYQVGASIFIAVFLAVLLHVLWNYTMVTLLGPASQDK